MIPPERPDLGARVAPARLLQTLAADVALIRELADRDIERLIDILDLPASKEASSAPNAAPSTQQAMSEHVAKMSAESKLEQAHQALGSTISVNPHAHRVDGWEAKPETLLRIAHQLFDAGGAINFQRSSELAQVVINNLAFAPVPVEERSRRAPIARATGHWASPGSMRARQLTAWVVALILAAAFLLYLLER
jgi:hypothetical protein